MLFIIFLLAACSKDPPIYTEEALNGYPEEVGKIMLTQCAIPGCHNDKSYDAAGGLNLTSWEKMFEGSRNNAAVIPYSSEQSFLLFFVNTFDELGPSLTPLMPFNSDTLTKEEVILISDWIAAGAANDEGFVKFSDNPSRSKFYVANQGCDLVSIFDAETGLIMRSVETGSPTAIESPHMVRVSPDGNYWYVVFFSGNMFQRYDAATDAFIDEVDIGNGSWNTFTISSDGKTAYAVNWNADGSVAVVDLENMQLLEKYQGSGLLEWPHGSTLSSDGKTLYLTAQTGNFIYKIDVTDINSPEFEKVVLETGQVPNPLSSLDPHEIVFTPNESKYFVTCQKSNEVRVFQTSNDSLVDIIPTGTFPQEFAISITTNYLFVSCTEDTISFPGTRGSVAVIDWQNNTFVKSINTGFQPHGIAVDEAKQLVYVAHRNIDSKGPAPHHTTDCGGRNGFVRIIDMNTLNVISSYKAEVSVDAYSVAVRNKK
ncbi:beta-propeller fold lactonase family protein [Bacteroidales bacterium AH-315-I05]|nr:beta-propeller fold lactonase family protein [Bacteroidales bacterium AH-315-I05]